MPELRLLGVGQQAHTRVGRRLHGASIGCVDDLVLAVSQKDEVVIQQPLQEVDCLLYLIVGVASSPLTGHLHHPVDGTLHRLEIVGGPAHISEHASDDFLDVGRFLLVQMPVELVVLD